MLRPTCRAVGRCQVDGMPQRPDMVGINNELAGTSRLSVLPRLPVGPVMLLTSADAIGERRTHEPEPLDVVADYRASPLGTGCWATITVTQTWRPGR